MAGDGGGGGGGTDSGESKRMADSSDVKRISFDEEESAADDVSREPSRKSHSCYSLDSTATPSEHVVSKWKRGARAARMYAQATATVGRKNKIGVAPEGWYRDAAMLLQQHVAADGRDELAADGRTMSGGSSSASTRPVGVWEAPREDLFKRARHACGFTPARYYATLGLQEGQKEPSLRLIGASSAAGRSGAFFFLTPDQQFFVKTCTKKDWTTLLSILEDYVGHLEGARATQKKRRSVDDLVCQPSTSTNSLQGGLHGFTETLLPRYLGLYRFQVEGSGKAKPIRVVVMTNVFAAASTIDRRYDLKGSTHGRKASQKELAKKSPVFKDMDYEGHEEPLKLDGDTKNKIMQVLREDTDFLTRHGLIDYSLLVGIHDRTSGEEPRGTIEGMLVTTVSDDSRLAYVGVVDILTPYAAKKRAETFFLGQLMCGRDISCQPPKLYARRFLNFISDRVLQETEAGNPEEAAPEPAVEEPTISI